MMTATVGPGAQDILIVEPEPTLARFMQNYLQKFGFTTATCARGDDAVTHIHQQGPRLVILSTRLPGLNGMEVCRRVRETYDGAILMLTTLPCLATEVQGLELGADDIVGKPVVPRALLARVRSLLRRVDRTSTEHVRRIGPLQVNQRLRTVQVGGEPVRLTITELEVLWLLCKSPGEVVTRHQLYSLVLGIKYDGLDRGMDVHISRLRSKLDKYDLGALAIRSVRGEGYVLAQQ